MKTHYPGSTVSTVLSSAFITSDSALDFRFVFKVFPLIIFVNSALGYYSISTQCS